MRDKSLQAARRTLHRVPPGSCTGNDLASSRKAVARLDARKIGACNIAFRMKLTQLSRCKKIKKGDVSGASLRQSESRNCGNWKPSLKQLNL